MKIKPKEIKSNFNIFSQFLGNTILQSNGKLYVDNVHIEVNTIQSGNGKGNGKLNNTNVKPENQFKNIDPPQWGLCNTCKEGHHYNPSNGLNDSADDLLAPAPIKPGRRRLTRQMTT